MNPDFLTVVLTRVGLAGLLLALFVPTTPQVMGEANALIGNSVYEVTVQVRLVPAYSAGPLEDSNRVVVWLVPTKPGQVARLHTEPPHYRIIQYYKMFEPRLLVVPAGSIVEFPKRDPWLHNVFSVSRSRRVSDKTGHISIGNVPHGKYVLQVWYENATPQVLEGLQRTIFVGDDNRSQPTISIALANGIPMTGKNYNSEQPTFVGANWGRR
jgi:hypothetical protein